MLTVWATSDTGPTSVLWPIHENNPVFTLHNGGGRVAEELRLNDHSA